MANDRPPSRRRRSSVGPGVWRWLEPPLRDGVNATPSLLVRRMADSKVSELSLSAPSVNTTMAFLPGRPENSRATSTSASLRLWCGHARAKHGPLR